MSRRRSLSAALSLITVLIMLLSVHPMAPAAPKPVEERLAKEEAAYLLASVFKSRRFAVVSVSQSPIADLWEVLVETDAGKTILYVDRSKKYFMGGPIMTLQGMKNMTEESLVSNASPRVDPSSVAGPLRRVDPSAVPLEDALVVGDPKARKRAVVFISPTCRPCKEMLQTIKEVSGKRNDLAFYLKMKPEDPVGESFWRSETIVLTRSLEFLEESLEGHKIPKPGRPVPHVTQTMALTERLGIHATPTTMLADGTLVEGALSAESLVGWMERHSPEVGKGKSEVGKK